MSRERAPVRNESRDRRGALYPEGQQRRSGTISWEEHLRAYAIHAKHHGAKVSAERIADAGGFGYHEITDLLGHEPQTWEPTS